MGSVVRPGGGGRNNAQDNGNLNSTITIGSVAEPGVLDTAPNPTAGELRLRLTEDQLHQIQVQMMDVNGKLLIQRQQNDLDGYFESELNLSHLAPGVYFLHIKTNQQIYTQRIVVDRGR